MEAAAAQAVAEEAKAVVTEKAEKVPSSISPPVSAFSAPVVDGEDSEGESEDAFPILTKKPEVSSEDALFAADPAETISAAASKIVDAKPVVKANATIDLTGMLPTTAPKSEAKEVKAQTVSVGPLAPKPKPAPKPVSGVLAPGTMMVLDDSTSTAPAPAPAPPPKPVQPAPTTMHVLDDSSPASPEAMAVIPGLSNSRVPSRSRTNSPGALAPGTMVILDDSSPKRESPKDSPKAPKAMSPVRQSTPPAGALAPGQIAIIDDSAPAPAPTKVERRTSPLKPTPISNKPMAQPPRNMQSSIGKSSIVSKSTSGYGAIEEKDESPKKSKTLMGLMGGKKQPGQSGVTLPPSQGTRATASRIQILTGGAEAAPLLKSGPSRDGPKSPEAKKGWFNFGFCCTMNRPVPKETSSAPHPLPASFMSPKNKNTGRL